MRGAKALKGHNNMASRNARDIQHSARKIINNYPEIHHVRLTSSTNFVCTFESRYLPHLLHETTSAPRVVLADKTPPQKKNELQQYHEIFLHSAIICSILPHCLSLWTICAGQQGGITLLLLDKKSTSFSATYSNWPLALLEEVRGVYQNLFGNK